MSTLCDQHIQLLNMWPCVFTHIRSNTLCLFIQHSYPSIRMSSMFLIWVSGILFSGHVKCKITQHPSPVETPSIYRLEVWFVIRDDIWRTTRVPKEKSAMASTPSASALSAVLRCQGNILARKRANKTRPAASVYGLGMKSSDRSYFRALLASLFHWEKLEIPGLSSVSTRCSRQSAKRNPEAKDQLSPLSKKCSKTKLKSDRNGVAFLSERCSILSRGNLLLRVDDTHLRKTLSECPKTFCVYIVCAQKSTLNHNETDSLFPLDLLSFLKNRLMCLTAAVSDTVRMRLGIDWTNQIDPDVSCGVIKALTQNFKAL